MTYSYATGHSLHAIKQRPGYMFIPFFSLNKETFR